MRRAVTALSTTAVGIVALLSYRTPGGTSGLEIATNAASNSTDDTSLPTSTTATRSSGSGTYVSSVKATTTPSTTAAAAKSSGSAKTYTGDSVSTRWGPVQVSITVSGGKITEVKAVDYPSENSRDIQINSRALPILRSEALAAQSSDIDTVSGATVTSNGYINSLQSALDDAGIN